MELNKSEAALIRRVEQRLAVWRYWKWIQLALGLLLLVVGVNLGAAERNAPLLWGLVPPIGICVVGGACVIHSIWNRIADERRLLLKLYEATGPDA